MCTRPTKFSERKGRINVFAYNDLDDFFPKSSKDTYLVGIQTEKKSFVFESQKKIRSRHAWNFYVHFYLS